MHYIYRGYSIDYHLEAWVVRGPGIPGLWVESETQAREAIDAYIDRPVPVDTHCPDCDHQIAACVCHEE